MAGDGKNLLWIEHSTLPAQRIFDFTVIQARYPARHDQQRFIADPETDRLGDLRGFDTVHLRRKLNSRRAIVSLDDFDVRCVRLKKGANRFKAHWLFAHIRLDLPRGRQWGGTQREGTAGRTQTLCGPPLSITRT